MDEIERMAQHRILALDAATTLQDDIGFDLKWRGMVENMIFKLIEEGFRRGKQYGHV
jgi:hypothetical protein